MTTMTAQTTQVYSVFIKATPEQIWDAITKSEFTQKYFYGVPVQVTPDVYDGGGSTEGAVVEFERAGGSYTAGAPSTTPRPQRRTRAASRGRSRRRTAA